MIDFESRVQDLQAQRRKTHHELDHSASVIKPDAMQGWRDMVEAKFDQGLRDLNAVYQSTESQLHAEISAARYRVVKASAQVPPAQEAARDLMKQLLPSRTPAQLVELYRGACNEGDIGGQVAVEQYVPPAPGEADSSGRAALMELAALAKVRQAERSQTEAEALAYAESKLKDLRDSYTVALAPVIQERARTQYRARESAF